MTLLLDLGSCFAARHVFTVNKINTLLFVLLTKNFFKEYNSGILLMLYNTTAGFIQSILQQY